MLPAPVNNGSLARDAFLVACLGFKGPLLGDDLSAMRFFLSSTDVHSPLRTTSWQEHKIF